METSVEFDTFYNFEVLRFRFPCKSNGHFQEEAKKTKEVNITVFHPSQQLTMPWHLVPSS